MHKALHPGYNIDKLCQEKKEKEDSRNIQKDQRNNHYSNQKEQYQQK